MRWFPSHIANFLFFILKVPKCEIFFFWILGTFLLCSLYGGKATLGLLIKNLNCFVLAMISKFFPRKFFWEELQQKMKVPYGAFKSICIFPKRFF
jgi:hypothetical protein